VSWSKDIGELASLTLRQARRVIVFVVGATLVVIGVVMLVTPGPAFVVVPLGLGVLGLEFAWARRLLRRVRDEIARRTAADAEPGPDGRRRRPRWVPLAVVAGTLSVLAAAGEVAVRATGRGPFRYQGRAFDEIGVSEWHEPDDVLGWANRPGTHALPRLDPEAAGTSVPMTVWEGGMRATAPERRERERRVVFLGGSFTYGWFLRDEETYPYRLQERFPEVEIQNWGTSAHGSYQCLLRLERILAGDGPVPELVVYAMIGDHALRDVAHAGWQKMLTTQSRGEPVAVPFCAPGPDGGLVRHEPQAYPVWPFSERSALLALLQERWAGLRARGREEHAYEASRAVIGRMAELCREKGSRFVRPQFEASNDGARQDEAGEEEGS